MDFWAALYFSTFLVLSSVILLNIVMAVLVDEFIRCVEAEKQADRLEQLADLSAQSCFLNTLDPLLRELCVSSTNLDAINSRIADLFHFCDVDESGDINYSEFREGLRKLPFDLPFSAEDWDVFASCEEELSAPMFLEAMQQQLNLYIHRLFRRTIEVEPDSSLFSVLLLVLKFQSMPASNAGEDGFLESNEIERTSRTLTPTETFDLPPAVCSKCGGNSTKPGLDTLATPGREANASETSSLTAGAEDGRLSGRGGFGDFFYKFSSRQSACAAGGCGCKDIPVLLKMMGE